MYRFADLLEKHSDEVAALETWDNGKPYEQAANVELPMVIRVFRYYAGMSRKKWISYEFSFILSYVGELPFYDLHLYTFQVGQIRFMVSQFQLMDLTMSRPYMNPLVLQGRLFHGIFLFYYILGRLGLL